MKKKIEGNVVKWGIIGVGDVCEVKSAPAMQIIENSALVAVMRRDAAKAKDYAVRHQVSKWYSDATELINDPEVNAIYIATPPNAHASLTLQAAQAGKPLYVEKPMARTHRECQEMISACEKHNVPLYVAYYRRCLPNFLKIIDLIKEGMIGEVRLVKIELYKTIDPDILTDIVKTMPENWRVDPAISGGGYYFDLAAHQLDFLDYAFGPIAKVNGIAGNQAGRYKAADIITGSFAFESGVQGIGSWCFSVDEIAEKDELVIVGSKGQIKMEFFGSPKFTVERSGEETITIDDFTMPHHIQEPLIQTIVDEILGFGECPSTGTSAARTNWVLEKMTENYY